MARVSGDGFSLQSAVEDETQIDNGCACKSAEKTVCCKTGRENGETAGNPGGEKEEEEQEEEEEGELYESTSEEEEEVGSEGEDVDMEDLGSVVADKNRENERRTEAGNAENDAGNEGVKKGRRRIVGKKPKKEATTAPREMITPALRAALTKQVWASFLGAVTGRWCVKEKLGRKEKSKKEK